MPKIDSAKRLFLSLACLLIYGLLPFALHSCQTNSVEKKVSAIDLSDPAQNYDAFMKIRADLSGKEVVFYWKGFLYTQIPQQRSQKLYALEGFNIARLVATDSGHILLTREVMLYKDPKTGEIIENWHNSFTGDTLPVVHVWNDPVNQIMRRENWQMPFERLGEGRGCFFADILLLYPSPLPKADFPEYSGSDLYQASELFQFFFSEDALDSQATSVYSDISWTRISPWLPWMKMGSRPGCLLYQTRGQKLDGGFDALPSHLKQYVQERHPEYAHAPETYTRPNETSWTYFKKLMKK